MAFISMVRIKPPLQFEPNLKQAASLIHGRSSIIELFSNPFCTIGTQAQAHCLLILPLNCKFPAGFIGRVINLSQVGFAHLLPVLIQKAEGALSRLSGRHNEIEVFYSDILLRSVFQKIIQINLTLRKSIQLNFQIFEAVSVC